NNLGKILRPYRDGVAPADNPLIGRPGVEPVGYAYGTRAPLVRARDPRSGAVWEVGNGLSEVEELYLRVPGDDYGWPLTTFGTWYDGTVISDKTEAPGIQSPALHWTPSIAPSSIALYLGDRYPQWHGDLFVGALIAKHLRRVRLVDGKPVEQ